MRFPFSPAALVASLVVLAAQPALSSTAQTSLRQVTPRIDDPREFKPNVRPRLDLQKAAGTISVDGDLDDAGWVGAKVATSFAETNPGDQAEPPVKLETWVTFDEENLYLAYLVEDDPARIRANMSDRDRIWQDDYVGMILDTYGDNAWAYFIAANPLGIQGDTRIVNGGEEDLGFDVVFQSEGQITDHGYQVEMAIPFRSLRFPNRDVQDWQATFWITHPRQSRSTYSWAALDRDDPCFMCQFGTLAGITGVVPGGKMELLPAFVSSQAGSLASPDNPVPGLDNGRVTAAPSLGLKYSFSSNLVADVAVNPDFSQIESDEAQIDVNTTFALNFPERRPFFQEGSDLYSTQVNQVYTRSINNPSAVGKFTGRVGRLSFGYVGGLDEDSPIIMPFEDRSRFVEAGRSYSTILRAKRTLGSASYIGAMVTDRRYLESTGSGSTFGLDSRVRLTRSLSLDGQFVASQTNEQEDDALSAQVGDLTFGDGYTAAFDGESFAGYAAALGLRNETRHTMVQASLETTSPTFRAANGFVTQASLNRAMLVTGYTFFFEDRFFERLTPHVISGYWWNYDGQRKDEFFWLALMGQAKGQTRFNLQYLVGSNEYFRGVDFRGLRRVEARVQSAFSDLFQFGVSTNFGPAIARNLQTPEKGNSFSLGVWGTIRPGSRLSIEPQFEFARMTSRATGEEFFEGYVARTRVNYQFSRRLFLRVVSQYNDFASRLEIDPLLTYKVNPFTAVYFGSTHDLRDFRIQDGSPVDGFYATDRQIFFKLQYLLRT